MMQRFPRAPALVSWLGYGGLVPFVGLALAIALRPELQPRLQEPLLQYAALILSFVGALHWGLAMRVAPGRLRGWLFGWSVAPCLIAWLALQLPPSLAVLVLECGYALHWLFDRRLGPGAGTPDWYPGLRLRLTVVATLCVATLLLRA